MKILRIICMILSIHFSYCLSSLLESQLRNLNKKRQTLEQLERNLEKRFLLAADRLIAQQNTLPKFSRACEELAIIRSSPFFSLTKNRRPSESFDEKIKAALERQKKMSLTSSPPTAPSSAPI